MDDAFLIINLSHILLLFHFFYLIFSFLTSLSLQILYYISSLLLSILSQILLFLLYSLSRNNPCLLFLNYVSFLFLFTIEIIRKITLRILIFISHNFIFFFFYLFFLKIHSNTIYYSLLSLKIKKKKNNLKNK